MRERRERRAERNLVAWSKISVKYSPLFITDLLTVLTWYKS